MSGDNRVFPPLSVPSLTLSSPPGGTFTPNVSTSLSASVSQTSPYSLILPAALPSSANQALLSDTSGNLSWGTVSSGTSSSTNTFSGASNVSTPTAITGLVAPSGSNQLSVTVFVSVKATTNLSALVMFTIYLNAAGTAYLINTTNSGDNIGISWSVNSAGQILYTSTTYAGFQSMQMTWTTPFTGSTTATTLSSLALSGGLSVGTNTLLAQTASSGSVSSIVGALLHVGNATYTDIGTAASNTATGTFSGTYLAAPTLAATNTSVTNPSASTLTISGPPTAGTNTTITNAYSLNILTGNAFFGGSAILTKNLYYRGSGGTGTGTGNNSFPTNFTTVLSNMNAFIAFNSTGAVITAPYACSFTISFSGAANGNNSIGTANVFSNIANTGAIRNDLLLYDTTGSNITGWKSWAVTISVSAAETLTIAVLPANGVTYQIGNLHIVQGARVA